MLSLSKHGGYSLCARLRLARGDRPSIPNTFPLLQISILYSSKETTLGHYMYIPLFMNEIFILEQLILILL